MWLLDRTMGNSNIVKPPKTGPVLKLEFLIFCISELFRDFIGGFLSERIVSIKSLDIPLPMI
jgi:hypothetical protein